MFQSILDQLRQLRDDFRAQDWWKLWDDAIAVQQSARDWIRAFLKPLTGAAGEAGGEQPPTEAQNREFDAICAEICGQCDNQLAALRSRPEAAAMAEANNTGFDPASIILIIKTVMEVLDWVRRRRHPEPVPTPPAGSPMGTAPKATETQRTKPAKPDVKPE